VNPWFNIKLNEWFMWSHGEVDTVCFWVNHRFSCLTQWHPVLIFLKIFSESVNPWFNIKLNEWSMWSHGEVDTVRLWANYNWFSCLTQWHTVLKIFNFFSQFVNPWFNIKLNEWSMWSHGEVDTVRFWANHRFSCLTQSHTVLIFLIFFHNLWTRHFTKKLG
jgi:hypothetical protein